VSSSDAAEPRRRRWVRTPAGGRENAGAALVAGAVAAGVGVVTFYLTRVLLAREPLDDPPAVRGDGSAPDEGRGRAW
jgi:hypothetical protein